MKTSVFVLLLCMLVPAMGQENSAGDNGTTEYGIKDLSVTIKQFVITGDNPLSSEETDKTLAPFTGENQAIEELQRAQFALTTLLKRKGYSFYRVTALPQELTDGVVTLNIQKYDVESITVKDNRFFSEKNLKMSLPYLIEGESPNAISLARNLNLANENPSKNIVITVAKGSAPGLLATELAVTDSKPHHVSLIANNTGSDDTGNFRIGASFSHSNLFDRDHSATGSYTTSPEDPNEVQQIGLNYTIPLYRQYAKLTAFVVSSQIDTGVVAEVFDVSGSGKIFGVGYKKLLPDAGNFHHDLYFQVADQLYDNDIDFTGQPIGVDVRSRPITVRYTMDKSTEKTTWKLFAEVSKNLDGGEFNDDVSYQATRLGASKDWSNIGFGVNVSHRHKSWLYQLKVLAAETDDRLIPGEQFGFGGARSGRGLEERELVGDKGFLVSLQLWAPKVRQGLLLGGFLDHGHVRNVRSTADEFSSESATTTGLSLLFNRIKSSITLRMDLGYVIEGINSVETRSQDGDVKLHVSASKVW